MNFYRFLLAANLAAISLACVSKPSNEANLPAQANPPTATIWVTGAHIMGANGLYFGPDGILHIASVVTSGILKMDAESGEIVGFLGPEHKVSSPDDIAFNDAGLLCWTDIIGGKVGCIEPDGTSSIKATISKGNNPITFSDDGRLFVGQCFFAHGMYEVYLKEDRDPRSITNKLGPADAKSPQCGFNGSDIGPDGKLYGPRWFEEEVARLDVDSGEFETYVSGFVAPASVKFDANGRLHVLDSGAGKVYRIEKNRDKTLLATLTPGMDNLAFNAEGRLFVSSYADGYIAEILADQKVRMVTPAGLSMAGNALITSRNGKPHLLVGDYYSLRYFDLETAEETHTVRDIIDFPGLDAVLSVGPGDDGLVLASWMDSTIMLWDEKSESATLSLAGMGYPIGALMYNGEIVFSEFGTRQIKSMAPEKDSSVAVRYQGDLASGSLPAGLAVSPDNSLYMTDYQLGSIIKLSDQRGWLESPVTVAEGLSEPEGLYVSGDTVYVVETGIGQVTSVALDSGAKHTLAKNLDIGIPGPPPFPPTMLFSGIAMDAAGLLYVPADKGKLIYRINSKP
jgi:sugar lactone lactonase YvrE